MGQSERVSDLPVTFPNPRTIPADEVLPRLQPGVAVSLVTIQKLLRPAQYPKQLHAPDSKHGSVPDGGARQPPKTFGLLSQKTCLVQALPHFTPVDLKAKG
jgi:hypothetical protein